ncbi:hypothetical protein HDU88_002073 [Geranomyces variabilis]|nr:hypothetical protein HDU88_002073 [Geranomyces variabilis]
MPKFMFDENNFAKLIKTIYDPRMNWRSAREREQTRFVILAIVYAALRPSEILTTVDYEHENNTFVWMDVEFVISIVDGQKRVGCRLRFRKLKGKRDDESKLGKIFIPNQSTRLIAPWTHAKNKVADADLKQTAGHNPCSTVFQVTGGVGMHDDLPTKISMKGERSVIEHPEMVAAWAELALVLKKFPTVGAARAARDPTLVEYRKKQSDANNLKNRLVRAVLAEEQAAFLFNQEKQALSAGVCPSLLDRDEDHDSLPGDTNVDPAADADPANDNRHSTEPYRNNDADNDDDGFYDALFPVSSSPSAEAVLIDKLSRDASTDGGHDIS